ncbi:LysR family transcriptional regulator [Roseateles amylovorans]|uniref:LysR family transcriptional regulator n=1 Tax=Roseateles amylovorans TaxID=2978473 RepID=A0ABY6B700_9BURK|nr:LysR family transcriptional regulator [Roseateles amylovorans]UXH81046.1 LysR family transcriptional regulator [Roseateles amylovorans]
MDQLRRMAVLATVVEQGSLVAAARQLQTTTSAVSQQLRALERDMGVTLLHRSTRRIGLTPAGERFVQGCQAMLAAAREAQSQLHHLRDAPEGELRISAPVGSARQIGPALAPLLTAHPGLSLYLEVDDRFTDLVAQRIDLAVRFGRLPDSHWVAQRIGQKTIGLYAAPSYLARRGVPTSMSDLTQHDWVALRSDTGAVRGLVLRGPDGQEDLLRVEPRASSNNQLSLQQMCEAGLGLAMLSPDDVDESQAQGRLLPLLQGWSLPTLPVHVMTPQRDAQPAKVRYAIEALRMAFSGVAGTAAR